MSSAAFTKTYESLQQEIITDGFVEYNNVKCPIKIKWDCGAMVTCISNNVICKLNVPSTGKIQMSTISTDYVYHDLYSLTICISDNLKTLNNRVVGTKFSHGGYDMLLGMDVIGLGDFAITNYNNQAQMTFRIPSQESIDFRI